VNEKDEQDQKATDTAVFNRVRDLLGAEPVVWDLRPAQAQHKPSAHTRHEGHDRPARHT